MGENTETKYAESGAVVNSNDVKDEKSLNPGEELDTLNKELREKTNRS